MTNVNEQLSPDDEITNVTFEYDGAHLALCHKSQGYSANGRPNALILKASDEITKDAEEYLEILKAGDPEVRIETDMVTFLRKWYGMWYDDAETLAMILGYNKKEVEEEQSEYQDYLNGKVEGVSLLKADKVPELAKASELKALQDFIKSNEALFKDSFSEGNSEVKEEDEIQKAHQINPQTKPNGDAKVPTEAITLEKANELQARLEVLEKANKEKEDRIAAFEKAAQERLEKAYNKKVEGYSFVTEEERPEVVKALMAIDNKQIMELLDKAQSAVTAITIPQGSDSPSAVETLEKSGVEAWIMAQFPEIK